MVVSMTIQNADNDLISAIKSVCKLHPAVKVSIKKEKSIADELKAEQAEILSELEKGTLKTYSSMEEYEAANGL
ncbi:MAG: hypothetical protein SPH83_04900 [Treponema sp.]|nr:hypothetical protein [Spirochaetales bacterium]MDY5917461.1 hypothetical protein [Treponema sp.]MDY6189819.1 hypothetical protein [Treponema sp.]